MHATRLTDCRGAPTLTTERSRPVFSAHSNLLRSMHTFLYSLVLYMNMIHIKVINFLAFDYTVEYIW